MLEKTSEEHRLQLSIAHKIFPLPVIERTLFLLRGWITSVEVTNTSSEEIEICIRLISTNASQDMEDLFHSRLISTAVSLNHDENNRETKQYFIQTAAEATTEPQQVMKRYLISQAREKSQFLENRKAYWDGCRGYRVELEDGFDLFVEEDANTFYLDLDDSVYSASHIQPVVKKMITDGFQCTVHTKISRIIVSVTFQEGITQSVMLKTLLDLHKKLRTFPQ